METQIKHILNLDREAEIRLQVKSSSRHDHMNKVYILVSKSLSTGPFNKI